MSDEHGDELQDEVQASGGSTERQNRHLQRSHSEQARYLSAYFGWSLHGDLIRSHGTTVSMFVEDLADTMLALGWLDGSGILWEAVPVDADRAVAEVRRHQMEQGWMPSTTE
ncbi:hypothetical protein [Clavibacter nebraskensis]|uniref:Uncharacterized protein n=2 Tax=Clavibacter nebraskensis TaxID=31963 RepID=A0A399P9C9_9MICO|nr:hypothetical protein [Clavibacter nebraskensis]KXU21348.1 hypothetical protein VV38_03845 [Clavibacter nebraskensis]OAH20155.1 hypothetical protein A3Q38_06020 [Clavibacter nebraskensis]QGV66099.1 hypothetical protein EGX36_04175 [Clavibacter nebraskensis]QGV68898.1 hypothetical protein EGX37_04165 [Clavibacter nebraskensis]QGV71688.1 hypothetical protein EGX35_04165 [Clavibacter nebraskensis]